MNTGRRVLVAVAIAGIALGLGACEKGPLEKAGTSVDKAAEKTGDKIKDIVK